MWRYFPVVLLLLLAGPVSAQAVVENSYCNYQGLPKSLRQTLVLIDGNLVVPEPDGPLPANQAWRAFATRFIDAGDPLARERLDARERVTLAIANSDGSGLTVLFTGCVPLFRADEEAELDSKTTVLDTFFGSDWRRAFAANSEAFKRSAVLALIQATKDTPDVQERGGSFAQSGLARSLTTSAGYALENGIPRVVIFTDISGYSFPSGDIPSARSIARADAENLRINLLHADVHLFGAGGSQTELARNYLEALFLVSRGRLATFTGANGAITSAQPPRSVEVFQGTIALAEGTNYPLRMRLALDQNGSVVNSWVEVQAVQDGSVPFGGLVTCEGAEACTFVGDNIFAQTWSDNPDPQPECAPEMPLGGLRNLSFSIDGPRLQGRMKDEVCYFSDREEGLTFELTRVAGALF